MAKKEETGVLTSVNKRVIVSAIILCLLSYIHSLISLAESILLVAMKDYLSSNVRNYFVFGIVYYLPFKDQLLASAFAALFYY